MKMQFKAIAFAAAALAMGQAAWAGEAEAKKWIDSEFQPSTLSKDQQMAEMKWFIDAAKKLQAKGVKEISVVSETITTHEYESKTLAKAFEEITGIKVKHDLIQEGDVVEKLQTSMQSGKSIYDGWISDSDLIGTHYRYGKIMNLTDYMGGAGKEWTNPGIDLKDYIGTKFTTGPDGKLYQLPDQQFANLYWFRADKHLAASLLIFAAPPALLLLGVLRGSAKAAFWAGVLALFWFSHGVMVAWSRPGEAAHAWSEIVLSLAVVLASSWPGLSARFAKRKAANHS